MPRINHLSVFTAFVILIVSLYMLTMILFPTQVNADFTQSMGQNQETTNTPTPTSFNTPTPSATEMSQPQLRNEALLNDSSLVDGDPCGPPCWRGIILGETTWQDALTIIEEDETLTNLDIRTSNDSNIQGALWAEIDGDDCCQMYTEDGETVDVIILQTAPNIILGKVIETYGEPSYVIGEEFTNDQGVVTLFYPEQQMVIYAFAAGSDAPLSGDSEVIGFGYFSVNRMEVLIFTNNLHVWTGYDSINNYMAGEYEVTPSITSTPTASSDDS